MNKHAFFVVLLGHFKMAHRESIPLCSFKKSTIRYDILYGTKTTRRKRKVGKEGSGVSHRARPRVETGGERLKTEGSGTSWPGGDVSISFSSSLPTEAFREGIEASRRRQEIAGEREKVSQMSHAGLLCFLLLFPCLTTFLLRKICLSSFQVYFSFYFAYLLHEKEE